MFVTKRPDTVYDERVLGNWRVKALFPTPYLHRFSQRLMITYVGYRSQVMLKRQGNIYLIRSSTQAAQHSLLENDARTLSDQEEVSKAMHNH